MTGIDDGASQATAQDEESSDVIECPNCKELIPGDQAVAHTVQCFRNSTKCKVCGEVIDKTKKKEHLERWRNTESLLKEILEDNEDQASLFFEHGLDVNMVFKSGQSQGKTPIHCAAQAGSLQVLLALISRGSEVDPLDKELRTPISLAIEKNKYTCVRSLIELGADIERKDNFGRTPLMFACKLGSKDMVELLLSYKCDINATNNMKESCMTFAQKSKNQELIMLLVKNGLPLRPASSSMMRPASGTRRPPSGIRK